MQWIKYFVRVPRYKFTSCNQHGDRYKYTGQKRLSVAKISCKTSDADGIQKLILLSHTLDAPVRYDFEDHEAYIEVVSNEMLKRCL